MLGKPFNLLILHQINPQNQTGRTWLEARLKRNYYPAEILTTLDMLAAGLMTWSNRTSKDPPATLYNILRKAILQQEPLDGRELQQIYDRYVDHFGHKPTLEEFYQKILPKISRLDQISLLIGLRPMGLQDNDENQTGLLFRIVGFTPQQSIFDFMEPRGADYGNIGGENQTLPSEGQRQAVS